MDREHEPYRRALISIIAAAYRVLDTWESGDLAGRVTALGKLARQWDEAFDLRVAGAGANGTRVERRRRRMREDRNGIAPAGVRAWATRGLDEAVVAALRLDAYPTARACADMLLFVHLLVVTSLPTSPEVGALLTVLEERVRRLAAHRNALDPATWSHRQEIEVYTHRLERRAPDGPLLATRLRQRYAALYSLLARLSPDADFRDHADAATVEALITELKDALGAT